MKSISFILFLHISTIHSSTEFHENKTQSNKNHNWANKLFYRLIEVVVNINMFQCCLKILGQCSFNACVYYKHNCKFMRQRFTGWKKTGASNQFQEFHSCTVILLRIKTVEEIIKKSFTSLLLSAFLKLIQKYSLLKWKPFCRLQFYLSISFHRNRFLSFENRSTSYSISLYVYVFSRTPFSVAQRL